MPNANHEHSHEHEHEGENLNEETQNEIAAFSAEKFFEGLFPEGTSDLRANSYPAGMLDADVRKLLNSALQAEAPTRYVYVFGFTADKVVYDGYMQPSDRYATFQRSYSINANKTVALGDDAEQVHILMEIVPTNNTKKSVSALKGQNMGEKTEVTTEEKQVTDPVVTAADPIDPAAEPKANAAPKVLSTKELLDQASPEVREMLESGLRMHNSKKATLIKALQDTGRCKYSEEKLKAMSLSDLETLSELANVPSFSGVSTPKVHAGDDENAIPAMPALFPAN